MAHPPGFDPIPLEDYDALLLSTKEQFDKFTHLLYKASFMFLLSRMISASHLTLSWWLSLKSSNTQGYRL